MNYESMAVNGFILGFWSLQFLLLTHLYPLDIVTDCQK